MTWFLCKFQDVYYLNINAFLDPVLGPSCSQNQIFYNEFQRFLDHLLARIVGAIVPFQGQKNNSRNFSGPSGQPMGSQKQFKNVKLSSKSSFSPQELRNLSQATHIKQLKNVKLSSKSCFSPQKLPNLSQDTNMKLLKNVKLSSTSGFSPQELPNISQDTNMK